MARKSRKNQAQAAAAVQEPAIRAALYIRLSVEDSKSGSISIETQKMFLNHYVEGQPEMFVYDTYIDNGATGTNFHRPGFQQMLSDIEAGHVNCVIVKDLSRLGRNTIDTGYYIERYFPQHKVRFIAVTDQYDSDNPDDLHAGIILPLKNMINEAYALDIGRKIKAQQRQAIGLTSWYCFGAFATQTYRIRRRKSTRTLLTKGRKNRREMWQITETFSLIRRVIF